MVSPILMLLLREQLSLTQGQAPSKAAAALAAARAAASGTGHGQVSVMETRRFAGKDIQVSAHLQAALHV